MLASLPMYDLPELAAATDGWWAEIVAKAVLIGGLGIDAGDRFAAMLVTVAEDGTVECDPRLAAVNRSSR